MLLIGSERFEISVLVPLVLEYEYAAGYDPQAFVQFFEKLGLREKDKHNVLAKAFATHPMNGDRIKRAQQAIASMLPGREQYVVNTSQFEEIKIRMARATALSGSALLHG